MNGAGLRFAIVAIGFNPIPGGGEEIYPPDPPPCHFSTKTKIIK